MGDQGGRLPQPLRTVAKISAALVAKPPSESVRDTLAVMDAQPDERLILRVVGKPVDKALATFDPQNARRLYELTREMTSSHVSIWWWPARRESK